VGHSHVNAFNLKTGRFLGQLKDANGQPLILDGGFNGPSTKGLWGIGFGNGKGGAGAHALFFAAGINDEADGVFGKVTVAREKDDDNDSGNDTMARKKDDNNDVAGVKADVQALTNALSGSANANVTADIKALNDGVSAVVADLSAGVSASKDLDAMIAAQAKSRADLGSNTSKAVHHQVTDLGKDLIDLRMDELMALKK
jgi:hypothetical protein